MNPVSHTAALVDDQHDISFARGFRSFRIRCAAYTEFDGIRRLSCILIKFCVCNFFAGSYLTAGRAATPPPVSSANEILVKLNAMVMAAARTRTNNRFSPFLIPFSLLIVNTSILAFHLQEWQLAVLPYR